MSGEITSLRERIVQSSMFSIGANVIRQSIGIVSMLVLARLLSPDDYGVVAAAMLVVYLFDVLSQTGTDQYILGRSTVTDTELHTAWTLRLIVRSCLALAVILSSAPFAGFFEEPRLRAVLVVMAAVPVIDALQSPGVLLLRREFKYRSIATATVLAKLLSFFVAVGIAVVYRSYWALVVANLVQNAAFSLASYRLHEARPRLELSNVALQWQFTKWTLSRAIVGYSRAKLDNFAVGRYLGVAELGVFTVSKQLATMPHMHLTESLRNIFLSSIGGSEDRKSRATQSFSRILVVLTSIMLPLAVGVNLAAESMIAALLGPAWLGAVPIVEALAPLTLTFSVCGLVSNTLIATGRIRTAFVLDLATLVVVIGAVVLVLSKTREPVLFAWSRTIAGFVVAALFYACIATVLKVKSQNVAMSLIPAVLATLVMVASVKILESVASELPSPLLLVAITFVGAFSYVVVLYASLPRFASLTDELKFTAGLLERYSSGLKVRAAIRLIGRR